MGEEAEGIEFLRQIWKGGTRNPAAKAAAAGGCCLLLSRGER